MKLFTYTNYCDSTDKPTWRKNYQRLKDASELFPVVQVVTSDILLADEAYSQMTGIDPFIFCGHTPPVLVSFE